MPYYFTERRAHVPLGAGSRVTRCFGVAVPENHLNETAPSGYVARLVRSFAFYSRFDNRIGRNNEVLQILETLFQTCEIYGIQLSVRIEVASMSN
jgi:hypothetical protein